MKVVVLQEVDVVQVVVDDEDVDENNDKDASDSDMLMKTTKMSQSVSKNHLQSM